MELPPPSKEQCVMKRQEYYEDIPPVAPVMRREDYMDVLKIHIFINILMSWTNIVKLQVNLLYVIKKIL